MTYIVLIYLFRVTQVSVSFRALALVAEIEINLTLSKIARSVSGGSKTWTVRSLGETNEKKQRQTWRAKEIKAGKRMFSWSYGVGGDVESGGKEGKHEGRLVKYWKKISKRYTIKLSTTEGHDFF